MAPAALEFQVADDDVLAFLQLQAFAGELDSLAPAVDRLVGGNPQVRRELDGSGDLEDDPERFPPAASLAKRSVSVV